MCTLSPEAVTDILQTGRIYEVGGAVRDQLIGGTGKKIYDRDYLVTGITYDRLTSILRRYGRVDLVGRSFGVIKFTQFRNDSQHTFDITLPRTEHSTGQGHRDFEVAYDPDLPVEKDLVRRDFTVNAMARDLDSGELVDPLDGRGDLARRELRIVYPESFTDDPLRMMRAVQFAARFDFNIEPQTFALMTDSAETIASVSPERIAEELSKLLVLARQPSTGFRLMQRSGLLKHVLPELEACVDVEQPGSFHKYNVFEHILRTIDECRPDLVLRLAAMFHDVNKPQTKRIVEKGASFYGHESLGARTAKKVMKRLRFGKEIIDDVVTLVDRHMFTTDVTPKGRRRLIRRVGQDRIFKLLDLRRADVVAQGMGGTTDDVDQFEADIRDELSRKPPFGLSDLALSGRDIMRMFGLDPSPTVGRILDHLLEAVLDEPEANTPERLEQIARDFYKENAETDNNASDKEDRL